MPTAVTAVPSVHYATIERRIPTWLKQAPPETQSAMRN
ncbi:hypothetical protein DW66_5264 [Pseudomonas putida]|nr:hypothetical protein DW66_5264 [Pseudomonas putida]